MPSQIMFGSVVVLVSLKLTAQKYETGWLEDYLFWEGGVRPTFRGHVSFREGICFSDVYSTDPWGDSIETLTYIFHWEIGIETVPSLENGHLIDALWSGASGSERGTCFISQDFSLWLTPKIKPEKTIGWIIDIIDECEIWCHNRHNLKESSWKKRMCIVHVYMLYDKRIYLHTSMRQFIHVLRKIQTFPIKSTIASVFASMYMRGRSACLYNTRMISWQLLHLPEYTLFQTVSFNCLITSPYRFVCWVFFQHPM